MSKVTMAAFINLGHSNMSFICVTLFVLLSRTQIFVGGTALSAELNELSDDDMNNCERSEIIGGAVDKRKTWQNLHGSWGKRGLGLNEDWNEVSSFQLNSRENDPEAWLHLTMPVNAEDRKNHDKISLIYLTNDKLQNEELDVPAYKKKHSENIRNNNKDDEMISEKRSWKNMNMVWGKRRQTPGWNKFRGVWGKREPSWNNLKGMWGKRAGKQWQKLHSGWGKRNEKFLSYENYVTNV